MTNIKETKEKIIKALNDKSISNIDEALNFLNEKEGAEDITEVDWKWEVRFEGDKPFKFSDDMDLIEWCEEQREKYFNED